MTPRVDEPQDATREPASLLRLVANSVPALMAFYEAEGFRCRFANAGYARTFGFTEQSILGRTLVEVIGQEAARLIDPFVQEVRLQRRGTRYERQLATPDGARWLDVQLLPHFDDAGELDGAFVLINDITPRREAEQRLSKFMEASMEGIVFHEDGVITDANLAVQRLVGWSLGKLLGRRTTDFLAADHVERARQMVAARAETSYESVLLHRDGTRIPVELITRMAERDGQPQRIVIVRDLRPVLAARERIRHLAHHDALTDLLNRAAFMERLGAQMTGGTDAAGALLFIDLDHFKRVNDSLGHAAGDLLLVTLAQRIVAELRQGDVVGRFGGDEFVVLLPGREAAERAHDIAAGLLAAIGEPVQVEGRPISVTPSIGVARYPDQARTADDLLKAADSAMYEAKHQGRAMVRGFEPEMGRRALAALDLEGQLTEAIARGEFELHYQPQVGTHDGRLVGCEALIRWRHPQRGLVEPDRFLPLTEEQHLIEPISRWVLTEALAAARRWRDAGQELPVAVNLSVLQLRDARFMADIGPMLAAAGLPPRLLEVEITERLLMQDFDHARHTLQALRDLGVRIALDDFGTGYSSLGTLHRLPIDRLKIDRSFVRGLPDDPSSRAIVRSIVMLAMGLGLDAVAEGVETEAQREYLAALGCPQCQGLLFGAPRPGSPFAPDAAASA